MVLGDHKLVLEECLVLAARDVHGRTCPAKAGVWRLAVPAWAGTLGLSCELRQLLHLLCQLLLLLLLWI